MEKINIDSVLENHKENVQNIFDKFGITAPVNKQNLQNAIKGIPSLKNIFLNTFENFEGEQEGGENQFTFETDAITGEEKKVRNKKILKDVFGFAKDTAQAYVQKRQGEQIQTQNEQAQIKDAPKKETKILGMSPVMFGGVCLIVLLIIVALVLKFKK